jgi:5'-nucleotidase
MRKLDGTPIRPDGHYTLALSDYLQGGGDGFAMLRVLPYTRSGKTDLEALVDYLKRLPKPVSGPRDVRWEAAGAP